MNVEARSSSPVRQQGGGSSPPTNRSSPPARTSRLPREIIAMVRADGPSGSATTIGVSSVSGRQREAERRAQTGRTAKTRHSGEAPSPPARPISALRSIGEQTTARLGGAQSAAEATESNNKAGPLCNPVSRHCGRGRLGNGLRCRRRAPASHQLVGAAAGGAAAIASRRANPDYLPGAARRRRSPSPPSWRRRCRRPVLYVQPAQHLRAFCNRRTRRLARGHAAGAVRQGLDSARLLLTDVARSSAEAPVAVLSGPSFAGEVAAACRPLWSLPVPMPRSTKR